MRGRAPGFTLLELVLAMAILAMVTGICYGAFFVGIRAVAKGEVAVVTAQRLRVATDVLIRQVKSAVPYPARNEDDEVYPFFRGGPTGIEFVTANGRLRGGGLARVRYYLAERDGEPEFILEETPYFGPDELGQGAEATGALSAVLLTGFTTLRFQYLLDDGADLEWFGGWDAYEEDTLPSAVRIVVEGMPGLEHDAWGQEIPVMVTSYGEANGEVDDDDLASEDLNEFDPEDLEDLEDGADEGDGS